MSQILIASIDHLAEAYIRYVLLSCMDNSLNPIKVIRLVTSDGYYLEALEDKMRVDLCEPHGYISKVRPKNTEWRVMWSQRGPTSKCCLWSIYNKVLTVRSDANGGLQMCQAEWPVTDGSAKWYLRTTNKGGLYAKLLITYGHKDRLYKHFLENNWGCYLYLNGSPVKVLCSRWDVKVVDANTESATQTDDIQQKQQHHDPCYNDRHAYDQVSILSRWQVGQVVFNTVIGGGTGTYDAGHFNSGHNVNGSGTQTNGDVNMCLQIGKQGDFSVQIN